VLSLCCSAGGIHASISDYQHLTNAMKEE